MTIKELIFELEKIGGQIGFDKEVWLAKDYYTAPIENVSKCVDMDTNITHAQVADRWNGRN